jgi:Flp pilus assembly pilin Flp
VEKQERPLKIKESKGQALAEYALIIALIALVCMTALGLLGGNISGFFSGFAGSF